MREIDTQSIVKRFEALAAEKPEALFLMDENRSWTRDEIRRAVNVAVDQLKETVTPGMHVGILISDSAFYMIAFLALLKLGATVVPFSPRWTTEAKQRGMEHTGTEYFLLDSQNKREARCLNAGYFLMNQCDAIWSGEAAADYECSDRPLDEPAVMLTTSGSTTEPRAAVITQRQMIARIRQEWQTFGLTEEDAVLISTPMHHALATRMMLASAYTGNRLAVMWGFTAEKWAQAVQWNDIPYAVSVPAQLAQIAAFMKENEEQREVFATMRKLVSTSAYLSPAIRDGIKRVLPESCCFYNYFASSETEGIAVADLRDTSLADDIIGVTVSMAEVQIERGGALSHSREIGEIVCRGEAVFDGYCIGGSRTESFGEDGFFRTGDLGYFDEQGILHFAGRKKDIIISGGMNIYPKDIETEIQKLEGVTGCVAYPIPDDILGEVVGVVVFSDDRVDLQKVKRRCLESLADYQQPRDIRFATDIPRSEIGKIARRTLYRELEAAG